MSAAEPLAPPGAALGTWLHTPALMVTQGPASESACGRSSARTACTMRSAMAWAPAASVSGSTTASSSPP